MVPNIILQWYAGSNEEWKKSKQKQNFRFLHLSTYLIIIIYLDRMGIKIFKFQPKSTIEFSIENL